MDRKTKEVEIKNFIETFDYIDSCASVSFRGILFDAIEVEIWANQPASKIRSILQKDLETKYPDDRFSYVFYTNTRP